MEIYTYSISALGLSNIQRACIAVCAAFKIDREALNKDRSRKRSLCIGRQIVWKIIRDNDKDITLKSLGEYFGGFDHTSVLHGITSINNAMLTDESLVTRYEVAVDLYANPIEYYDEK